tara:strand:- start:362 stop:514 length:153 start_codon:yes stop_codon:yes gene_type:complete
MNKRPAPNTGKELIKLCAEKLNDISPDQKKKIYRYLVRNFKLSNQKTLNE